MKRLKAYVGPRDKIVRALVKRLDDRVLDNFLGKLQVERVLNEVEYRLAPGRIAADVDVRFEIRDHILTAVLGLPLHSLKEHLHGRLEPRLNIRARVTDTAGPVAMTYGTGQPEMVRKFRSKERTYSRASLAALISSTPSDWPFNGWNSSGHSKAFMTQSLSPLVSLAIIPSEMLSRWNR